MDVLVTGDKGYIGSELSKHLDFESYDLQDGKDITNHKLMENAVKGKDAVIHLAGIVGEKACKANVRSCYIVNVSGTYNLVRYCRKHNVPQFIFASTCSIHRALKGHFGYYNSSKLAGEIMTFMQGYQFLRLGSVYGGEELNVNRLVDDMLDQAQNLGEIKVYGPELQRPLVHVEDVARAIVFSLEHPPTRFYEVANENVTKLRIAELITDFFEAEISTVESEAKTVGYYANNEVLLENGFHFKWTLTEYLRELNEKYTLVETHRPQI